MRYSIFPTVVLLCCCLRALAIPVQPSGNPPSPPPPDAPPPDTHPSLFSSIASVFSGGANPARIDKAVPGTIYSVSDWKFEPATQERGPSANFQPKYVLCYASKSPMPSFAALYGWDNVRRTGSDPKIEVKGNSYYIYTGIPFVPTAEEEFLPPAVESVEPGVLQDVLVAFKIPALSSGGASSAHPPPTSDAPASSSQSGSRLSGAAATVGSMLSGVRSLLPAVGPGVETATVGKIYAATGGDFKPTEEDAVDTQQPEYVLCYRAGSPMPGFAALYSLEGRREKILARNFVTKIEGKDYYVYTGSPFVPTANKWSLPESMPGEKSERLALAHRVLIMFHGA